MQPEPPESTIVPQLIRTFPASEIEARANVAELFERKRDLQLVPFFWTLVFGFVTGNDRPVQAHGDQFLAHSDDVDSLAYTSFSNWFTPELQEFLRAMIEDHIEDHIEAREPRHEQLEGRLAPIRVVLIGWDSRQARPVDR